MDATPPRSGSLPPLSRPFPPRRPRSRIGWWLAASALAATAVAMYRQGRWAERKHPPVGRFIDIDGTRVHYAAKGNGRPVVLVHGNGTMVHDWMLSGLFDRLARDHRVIAVDRPGYGYTERPRDRIWTAGAQAELLRRTVSRLGAERPILVGHSWGATVALAYALEHPDEVSGLVLLSGYYFPTRRLDVWMFASPAVPLVGDVMRYTVAAVITRLIAPRLIRKSFEPVPVPRRFAMRFPLPLSLRPWQLRASAEDSAIMIPTAAALQQRYRELEMPVALLSGDGDRIVTPERQSFRLHREIAESSLAVLPGLGHMIQHGAQDRIVEAIETVAERARGREGTFSMREATRPEHRPVGA